MTEKNKKKITRRDLFKLGVSVGAGAAITASGAPFVRAEEETPKKSSSDKTLPQVPRRVLGKTGETVPILLMGGAMKLDSNYDPKLAEAFRFGVDYFDVADCYNNGKCEAAVGSFVNQEDLRKKVWITSKSDKHDPKGLEETLAAGLERFGTDYFDMYYLHAVKDPASLDDSIVPTVERLKKEGKIRFFGFSCHDGNVDELLTLAATKPWIDSIMFRYDYSKYGNAELNKAIDACVDANIGLIAMKTQRSEVSFQDSWKKFEQTGNWNKHQAVLKAVWADDRISAAVSHMDTFEKLKENIAAAVDQYDLGRADLEALERYSKATRRESCDGCDHICGPAVDAPVEIASTLRFLMYHDMYGEKEKAKELFRRLPAQAQKLDGVDFRPANRACPNGVDVAAHMDRAKKILAG
jgi:predicted aldo/keto reductase-like oxidoreductase